MPKIKYKELAAALRQDFGNDVANLDDLTLAQNWVNDNPDKADLIEFNVESPPTKRTGNLMEDLKSAPPLPRTRVAFQRERGGVEVPFIPQQFGFQGGEMVQPARPEIDESSLESPFVQVDSEPVLSRGVEILPTKFSNTIEGRNILDFTAGKKDLKSIEDYYKNIAKEGAVGSESDFGKGNILANSLFASEAFAADDYNENYPDAPLSFDDIKASLSNPEFANERNAAIDEINSTISKANWYGAMDLQDEYNQYAELANQLQADFDAKFGDFERSYAGYEQSVKKYGIPEAQGRLAEINERVLQQAKELDETNFFGKAILAASRLVGGGGYLLSDFAGALGATDIADKMKSYLTDSLLATKDPRLALFKAPYDPKTGQFVEGGLLSANTLGFVFEQGLNMIPSIVAAATPYGRLGQLAVGAIGTAALTYDEYSAEIDQAALQAGAKIDPQTRAILSAVGAAKTGLIENAIPINRFFKNGMSKAFSENAVKALASGKSLDFAIKAGTQGIKAFGLTSGVEVAEELLDQGVQESINASITNQFPELKGQPQFEEKSLEDYAGIAVNTLVAVAPLGGVGFAYSGSRLKEDLFHNVARNNKVEVTLDLFEQNKDKFKDSQYKKNVDRLSLIGNIYGQIPEDIDDVSARKIADKMLEIESINSKMDKNTPQAIRDRNTAKIDKINQEISAIFSEAEMSRPTVTEAPEEAFPTIELQIPESDQNVLNAVSERIEPIIAPLVQRMTNAEEIDMAEIEAVAEQMIDEQSRILESENLSEAERQNLSDLIESQIDNLLNYEFATTTTTEQAGEARQVKGVIRTAKPGLPQKISTDRFIGVQATNPETGEQGRLVVTRVPITQSRTGLKYQFVPNSSLKKIEGGEYKATQGILSVDEGTFPSTPLTNMQWVSSNFDQNSNLSSVVVRDAVSGNELRIDDQDLALDIAIAESQRQIGTVPEGAILSTAQKVVPMERLVKVFPNIRETGTAPEAAGVQPQTEQYVRQETNVTQERGDEGEASSRLPQEEGRQEGQVTPAVEGEAQASPTAKKKKTAQDKAEKREEEIRKRGLDRLFPIDIDGTTKEGKKLLEEKEAQEKAIAELDAELAALEQTPASQAAPVSADANEKLKETLKSLKAKLGGGANIDLTFGVVPITKAVWNTAIDTAILAIDAGQTIAQAVKAASDYISSQIKGDWGKGKFESYMNDQFTPSGEFLTIFNASPKELGDLGKRSGVAYFATDEKEAKIYADMNRGKVREFKIKKSDVSTQDVVLDKIKELGLKPKDSKYTIDEALLYELIDDRFDNSLSQSDINRLFNELKKDGVKAFSYDDGGLGAKETTQSVAIIDQNTIVESSVEKAQEGTKADAKDSLKKRLSGDSLLNAEDTLNELIDNKATINQDGSVVVYHRTSKEKAEAILNNNEMTGLEDGVFFSTSEKGQAEGYGRAVVRMSVPIESIEIDDTFGNEAHVRIPTRRANQKISIEKFSPSLVEESVEKAQEKPTTQPDALKDVESTAKALDKKINVRKSSIAVRLRKLAGIIAHGGEDVISKFDFSKIKGGLRGRYGKGIYFSSLFKNYDYGDKVTYLDTRELNLMNGNMPVYEALNTLSLPSEIKRNIGILENSLYKVKNSKDYNEISSEIKKLESIYSKFDENSNYIERTLQKEADKNPSKGLDSILESLEARAIEANNLDTSRAIKGLEDSLNNMLIESGFDGINVDEGREILIFPQEKINDYIVQSQEKFISEAYHKAKKDGSNPELVRAVEDLLGAKAEPTTEKTGTKAGRAEYGKMKDSFFGGMEPNKNRLFFADATNDFQYRGDSRADIVLMLDGANFWLTEGSDGYVTIEDFQVSEDKLGTGKGKFALSKLIEYADRNGITLIGEPLAQAERGRGRTQKGLSQKQLIEFYKKNGFEKISKDTLSKNKTAENAYLERKPKDLLVGEQQQEKAEKPKTSELAKKAAKSFSNWVRGGESRGLGIANLPEQDAERFKKFTEDVGELISALINNGVTRASTALKMIKPYFAENESQFSRYERKFFKEQFNLSIIDKYPDLHKRAKGLEKKLERALTQKEKLLAKDVEEARNNIIEKIKLRLNPSSWSKSKSGILAKARLTNESISELKLYSEIFNDESLSQMDGKELKALYNEINSMFKSGARSQSASNKILSNYNKSLKEKSLVYLANSLGASESVKSLESAKAKSKRAGVTFYVIDNKSGEITQISGNKISEWESFLGKEFFESGLYSVIAIDTNRNTLFKNDLLKLFKRPLNTIKLNHLYDIRNMTAMFSGNEDSYNFFKKNFIDLVWKADYNRDELKQEVGRFDKIVERLKKDGININVKKRVKSIVLRIGDAYAEGTSEKGLDIGQIINVFMMLRDPQALVRSGGEGLVNYNKEDIDNIIQYVLNDEGLLRAVNEVTQVYQDFLNEQIIPVLTNYGYSVTSFEPKEYDKNSSFSKNAEENARAIEILNKVYSNKVPQSVPYSPLSIFGEKEVFPDVLESSNKEDVMSVMSNNVIPRKDGGQIIFSNVAFKYNNYMDGMIDMITRMPLLNNAKAMFGKDQMTLIRNRYGNSAADAIKSNIQRVVTDKSPKIKTAFMGSSVSDWVNRSVLGQMWFNTRAALFQPIAILNFAPLAPSIGDYFASIKSMNFVSNVKEIQGIGWVKERFGGKILSIDAKELEKRNEDGQINPFAALDKLLKIGYTPTQAFDFLSIIIGGGPLYDSVKNKKYKEYIKTMDENAAKTAAQNDASLALYEATNESQQSANNMLISNAQRNPLLRLLMSFTTANQQLTRKAILSAQLLSKGIGDPARHAYIMLQFGLINTAIFTIISRTPELVYEALDFGDEDEDKDLKKSKREKELESKYFTELLSGLFSGFGVPGSLFFTAGIKPFISDSFNQEKYDELSLSEKFDASVEKLSDYISSAAPGLSIKFRQLGDSVKSFGEGEILRGIANAASALIGIPSSRVFELFDQFAEASTRDYNAMERVLRATDIFNKSWSEKHYQEQVLRGKIEPKTKIEKDEIKKSNIKELNSMMRDLGFRAARQSGAERDKTIDKVKRYVDYAAREYSMTLDQYEDLIKRFNKGYFTGMVPDEFLSFARLSSESKVKAIAKKINSINDAKERNNYIIRLDNANIENDILSESEIEKVRNLLDDK